MKVSITALIASGLRAAETALGMVVLIIGCGVVWCIDRFYALAGRLEDGETEHWE